MIGDRCSRCGSRVPQPRSACPQCGHRGARRRPLVSGPVKVLVAGLTIAWVAVVFPREQRLAVQNGALALLPGLADGAARSAFARCQSLIQEQVGEAGHVRFPDYSDDAVTLLDDGLYRIRADAEVGAPDGSVSREPFGCTLRQEDGGSWLLETMTLWVDDPLPN